MTIIKSSRGSPACLQFHKKACKSAEQLHLQPGRKQVSPGKGWIHTDLQASSNQTPGRQRFTGLCSFLLCQCSRECTSTTKACCAGRKNTTHIVPLSVVFCSEMCNSPQSATWKLLQGVT